MLNNGSDRSVTEFYEHEQIQEILDSLYETIVEEKKPAGDYEEERLLKYLQPHNDSEETVVYPAVDKHLDAETIETIFERMDHTGEP
jgi:hemerythrin superfamily protein